MKKRKLYLYNPETDNFERFYPSIKDRLWLILTTTIIGLTLAVGFYLVIFYLFETPTVENLTEENIRLRSRIKEQRQEMQNVINRLDYSMSVMRTIQQRDSNFYRVVMQMDSISADVISPDRLKEEGVKRLKKVNDSKLAERLMVRLDSLDDALIRQSASFVELINKARENKDKMRRIPSIMPLHTKDYTLASGYGKRIDPMYDIPQFHEGLDFAANVGTPVYATADGEISVVATDKSGYGNYVDIEHGFDYMTRYGHMSKILVKQGQTVKRGEMIGYVGSSGKSTGPHLHYEVRLKGEAMNPVDYYFMDLTPSEYDLIVKQAANAGHVMD